jgi:S-(hydroxymethyl)glutathione dehydrogenase / alcohol dehydrogenase
VIAQTSGSAMTLEYSAAVLHRARSPLTIEQLQAGSLAPSDVLVRIRAAGLCHTDLEVIEGSLRYPMPIVLGHEAAGVIEEVGTDVRADRKGDHVVLSWNPHCGHCFYCDRDLPILCEQYLAKGAQAVHFDGQSKARLSDGRGVRHLMFLGAFAEYCVVPAQQAISVSRGLPFDRACLIGCGVMTGVGAALNIARIGHADTVMVIGCGAVGLSAIQGARLAGAAAILAVDIDDGKLELAGKMGASHCIDARKGDPVSIGKAATGGRGVDAVIEAAGNAAAFPMAVEVVRPGGEVVWLGKIDVADEVAFRWGALMQEKRIRRSSYGGARPARDFPMLARAYLDGRLLLDELITRRISLAEINAGFAALRNGRAIRTVVTFS